MKQINCQVKKNDQVMVIAGKDRGKAGKILTVIPQKNQVIVEKVNFIKRHVRPSAKHRQGGIIEREGPIHISNVMVICAKCNKPSRLGRKLLDDGKKARMCVKCGEILAN
jgi:large subunit ribosomal protein L24